MAIEEPRLARPRGDVNKWGAIVNKFLRVAHNENGTLKDPGTFDGITLTDDITAGGTGKFKRILAGGVET